MGKVKTVIFDTNILMATEDYPTMFSKIAAGEQLKPIIPLETLRELDGLKNAEGRKGFQARRAIRKIRENLGILNIVYLDETNSTKKVDDKIVDFAVENDIVLVTNDIAMELNAKGLGATTQNYYETKEVGTGWREVELSNSEGRLDDYETKFEALSEIMVSGEYVIFKEFGLPVATFVKLPGNEGFSQIGVSKDSPLVLVPGRTEKVAPKDPYQTCAIDSLIANDFSIITGKAGTGKTLLSISRMLEALEHGQVSKIVIFTNPTKARGAEQLGFYTGDRNAKLLQNSIGAILISKLGSIIALEEMLADETLVIMPMSDIRGYEVPANAYLYISEAQNADVDLLQLAIQRASGGPIIIEGDPYTQLDHWSYGGENNGMLRAIDVFRGFESFGHVHLPIIYRSKIAERAALMTEARDQD